VKQALKPGQYHEVITDRRSAIHRAVELAQPGDIIVIAGKGHETYQILKNGTIHFDDREEARKAVLSLNKNA
jgi:UDP-N-acetylmuramyl tripeptide synthase